jgi:hypothetical protein
MNELEKKLCRLKIAIDNYIELSRVKFIGVEQTSFALRAKIIHFTIDDKEICVTISPSLKGEDAAFQYGLMFYYRGKT